MTRWIAAFLSLALLAGCSGGTGGVTPALVSSALRKAQGDTARHRVGVRVTMRVPRRHRGERMPVHPATISALTQSVSIAVNGGTPSIFNTTPSSPGCGVGAGGTTCTFTVTAPPGNDTFAVVTYNAASGGGTPLDSGSAVIAIVAGKANAPHVTLGPVVSTTGDSGVGSLRYAIGSANPGDTIMFMLPAGSTITVASPLTLNTSVSVAGPGVTTSIRMHRNRRHPRLHSNLSFSGVTIDGGGTQQIFVVKPGVIATISGLILTNGLATTPNRPGGAVYNEGTLTLAADALSENDSQVDSPFTRVHHSARASRRNAHRKTASRRALQEVPDGMRPHFCATYYGGAVYNHGALTVSGSTFDSNVLENTFGCTTGFGGAIYNDQYGTLTSDGNTYSNNEAYYGGAVYNNATYGSASFTNDTFSGNYTCNAATGCPVAGCTGSGGCTSHADGEGGAIFDNDGPGITVVASTFSNNVAAGVSTASIGLGGAIYLANGSPSITGSTFSGNLAGGGTANCSYGEGGAIFEATISTLELDNDTFTNNVAAGDDHALGGAVFDRNEPDRGSGNTFTGNQASSLGSPCQNQGTAAGGALYADYGTTMSASRFSNNSATANYSAYAGAVYENDASRLTNDTFTSNSATGNGANGAPHAYAEAGAIKADCCLWLTGDSFTGNSASTQSVVASDAAGGAVVANSNLTTSGNTFTSNTVTTPLGGGYLRGAALLANGPTWSSNGDTFKSNAATVGYEIYGGAVNVSAASYTINGATFDSNTARGAQTFSEGAAIYLDTPGTISNSTFTNNVADVSGGNGYGGAIYDNGGATLNALTVSGNSASIGGGGLYLNTDDTVNGSTFSNNSVTDAVNGGGGGAIYTGGTAIVTSTTIAGNSAVASAIHTGGGGIYDNNGLVLVGSTLSGNTVTGSGTESGGGGIYVNYTSATIVNSTITKNSTTLNGGGVYTLTTPLALTNVTLYQNSANSNGGNIEGENSTIALTNSVVGGGIAGTGADIDTDTSFTSKGYNLIGTPVTGSGTFTPATGDQIGTNAAPLDPKLLALSNNGGPTFTMADTSTSPGKGAIPFSGGNCGNATGVAVDQRNFSRGGGGFCDIGAYEFGGTPSAVKLRLPVLGAGKRHQHLRARWTIHPFVPR